MHTCTTTLFGLNFSLNVIFTCRKEKLTNDIFYSDVDAFDSSSRAVSFPLDVLISVTVVLYRKRGNGRGILILIYLKTTQRQRTAI